MTEENALIAHEKLNPIDLFVKNGVSAILTKIEVHVNSIVADVETEDGRQEIKSTAYNISRAKTTLDNIGKKFVAGRKKEIKKIDNARKFMRDTLDELKTEFRKPLTDFENAEKAKEEKRIENVKSKIDYLESLTTNYHHMSQEQIQEFIDVLEAFKVEIDEFYEFTQEAEDIKANRLQWAKEQLEKRIEFDKQESERKAELEKLEAERKKQEEEAARLEAERKAIEEERRKIEEAKRLEIAKKEAAEKALQEEKERKEREEQQRIEREKDELARQERKERMRPDKEKLEGFSIFLMEGITYPQVESVEAQAILQMVRKDINVTAEKIFDLAQEL